MLYLQGKKHVFADFRKFKVRQKARVRNLKATQYKSANNKKRLSPQIANPQSVIFAEGPQNLTNYKRPLICGIAICGIICGPPNFAYFLASFEALEKQKTDETHFDLSFQFEKVIFKKSEALYVFSVR
jgi:hypothetical protein